MKYFKLFIVLSWLAIIAISCQQVAESNEESNAVEEAFKKNSATIQAYLDAWQNESVDYDQFYAPDYAAWGTGFGDIDTMNLEKVMEWDQRMFEIFDFKMVTDPTNYLPGVNVETKEMDGSVRLYSEWEVTRVATDSSEARTGNIKMYQAFVFNDEGKIQMDLTYGDFGGLMQYLFEEEQ